MLTLSNDREPRACTTGEKARYPVRLDVISTGPRVDSCEAGNATLTGGVVAISGSNAGYSGTCYADFRFSTHLNRFVGFTDAAS
jgi:hypothetical protein